MKDYLIERIRTPVGEHGSLVLFNARPFAHKLFAVQVCESEHSETVRARGVTRNRRVTNPGTDNEFWDCLIDCCRLTRFANCVYVLTSGIRLENTRPPRQKKSFRERFEERKNKKGA